MSIIDRTHPTYDDYKDEWLFFLSSYEGGQSYIDGDNLFTHRLELSEDFRNRKERAYYLNYCSAVVESYTNFIYSKEVNRPSDDFFSRFYSDVTGSGDDINSFMRDVSNYSGACGFVYILFNFRDLTPFPKTTDNKVPLSVVKEYNLYPYLTLYTPDEVVDYSIDSHGNFDWIIIEEEVNNDSDPMEDRETLTIRNLITRDSWTKIDVESEEIIDEPVANPYNFVPVIVAYNMKKSYTGVGISTIKDIAYVNRAVYNWCSNIDEMIERQTFSQLTCPDDGSIAEAAEAKDYGSGSENPLAKVGTSAVFTFPANAGHPPRFISPDTAQIEVIWSMIVSHIKQIYVMAGLVGTAADVSASSGRAKQQQFYSIEANLTSKAENLERTEIEIAKMYYRIMKQSGADDKSKYQVVYPRSFDVLSFVDYLNYSFDVISRSLSDRLTKYVAEELSLKLLKSAPDKIKEEVKTEINNKDAQEIVESVRIGGMRNTFGQSIFGSTEYKSPSNRSVNEKPSVLEPIKKDTGEGRPIKGNE